MLVTLAQAREHLQATHSTDDADLTLKIEAASEAVCTYLKRTEAEVLALSPGLKAAQQATLLLVGESYINREGEQGGAIDQAFGFAFLPRPVVALLYPYRDPSFA